MKDFLRSWWRVSLGLALLVTALATTPGLWQRFNASIQHQRDLVWARLEAAVGQKIAYDRIAPTVLSALDFQNVRLLADNGDTVLKAASLRFAWDWSLVFQGRFAEALRRVQLVNATLNLDATRDAALIARTRAMLEGLAEQGVLVAGLRLEAFNLMARWTDGNRSATLQRVFFTLEPKQEEWGLRYRGWVTAEDRSAGLQYVSMTVRGDLRSDLLFQNLSLKTSVTQGTSTWFDLEPVTVQVNVNPDKISIVKVADRVPLDFRADQDRASGTWTLKGQAESFRPASLVHARGTQPWRGYAEGVFTGSFSYEVGGHAEAEGVVSWPSGVLPEPFSREAVQVTGGIAADGSSVRLHSLRVDSTSVALDFDGSLDLKSGLPDGTLRLERWSVAGAGEAGGDLQMSRTQQHVEFAGNELRWNALGLVQPRGWVQRTESGWSFEVSGGWKGSPGSTVATQGSFQTRDSRWAVSVSATSISVDSVAAEVSRYQTDLTVPKALLGLHFDLSVTAEGASSDILAADSSYVFFDPDQVNRRISGTAGWRNRRLDVAIQSLRWGDVQTSGSLSAEIPPDGPVDWSLGAKVLNWNVALVGTYDRKNHTAVFSGTPGIEGDLREDAGLWKVRLALAPLAVAQGWSVAFRGRGELGAASWTVEADQLTVQGQYPWSHEPFTVRSRAEIDPENFVLNDLGWSDSQGTLTGTLKTSWSSGFEKPWAGTLSLNTPNNAKESVLADWVGTAPDRWHVNLRSSGLDLSRAGIAGLKGRLGLTAVADWRGWEAVWSAQAAFSQAQYGDSPLGFRAALSGSGHHLSVRNLSLSVNPVRVSDGNFDLDLDRRTWQATLGTALRIGGSDWETQWKASGTASAPGTPWKTAFQLKASRNTWAKRGFADWGFSGFAGDSGWGGVTDDGGLSGEGTKEGTFEVKARAPLPIQGELSGTWRGDLFDVAVRNFRADLLLARDFVDSKIFTLKAGVAEGDLHLQGSPADPDVTGTLVLRGLEMETIYVRYPLRVIDAPVFFDGHVVRIPEQNVGPKGQGWLISAVARLDHLLPEEYQIDIRTDPLSTVPASYQANGISAEGNTSGVFQIKGNTQQVTLGGRLTMNDTSIILKDTAAANAPDPLDYNVDLTLVTGRKVEFLWPNRSLPLIRGVSDSGQVLTIKANQVASTWSINGKLALKTGEINYLNRTFLLRQGLLVFQENQSRFDPQISLRAEWRIQDESGPVIVILRADGSLAKFSPRFESSPYVSPAVLQQLLGTSSPAQTGDNPNSGSLGTALSMASEVGASVLLTPVEESIRRALGLDLFSVQTQILKRPFLGRNDSPNAVDYLDNTRLFFGKYIGDDLFAQGTLAFYQGVVDTAQSSQAVRVDPEVEMDLQTPFFALNWTLLLPHPTTYFVMDNTVTLRWNWSY